MQTLAKAVIFRGQAKGLVPVAKDTSICMQDIPVVAVINLVRFDTTYQSLIKHLEACLLWGQ